MVFSCKCLFGSNVFLYIWSLYWWYISWYRCSPRFHNCPLVCICCCLSSQQGRCYPVVCPFPKYIHISLHLSRMPIYGGGVPEAQISNASSDDFLISRKFPNTILNTLFPPSYSWRASRVSTNPHRKRQSIESAPPPILRVPLTRHLFFSSPPVVRAQRARARGLVMRRACETPNISRSRFATCLKPTRSSSAPEGKGMTPENPYRMVVALLPFFFFLEFKIWYMVSPLEIRGRLV